MKTTNQELNQLKAVPTVMNIELLALDLKSCTRCVGTLDHIENAIAVLRPVLETMEISVNLSRMVIGSEEQARQQRFVSSPTIRINGKDIAFEIHESECDSCTDLCACDEGTSCRIWHYRGEEFTEAPVGLIVESILREILEQGKGNRPQDPAYTEVPENLRNFFQSKALETSGSQACCSESEQETCCMTSEKSTCCKEEEPQTCGCK